MCGAMFSKSLIQFSVDGWGCVPLLLFTWGQTMVEVMEIMVTSFKRSHACTFSAPSPPAGRCRPAPLLETPGHLGISPGQSLVGSLLLSPGSWWAQGFVCALLESVSSVLCKFWQLYGGVNGDLRQEGLCHTQVCCTQSPCGRPLLTCTSTGDTQTQFWLSFCGLGMHFMPFPGLSISGDQVLCDHTVPGGPCILITSPVPAAQFSGFPARALSQVLHVSSELISLS